MIDEPRQRPSLKDFDAYADRNGQDLGQEDARDIGLPARTQADLKGDPAGDAQTARIASGMKSEDATAETEAETPPETLRHIGDAAQASSAAPKGAAKEAVDRATASVGQDEEEQAMPNDNIPISGTRKPDEDVGSPGEPAVAGGGQTAQQAEITGQKSGARTDADRKTDWSEAAGEAGRNPTPVGGSSDGQSDRKR